MPISASQHRMSVGDNYNKLHNNLTRKSTQINNLNIAENKINFFGSSISRTINSCEEMNCVPHPNIAPRGITASLLMLLCHIRLPDNSSSIARDNSTLISGHVVPCFDSGSGGYSTYDDGYLGSILSPLTKVLYDTGQFISRHDPLRFPLAEAVIISSESASKYEIQDENINQDLFYALTGKNILDISNSESVKPVIIFYPVPQQSIDEPAEIKLSASNSAYEKYISNNCHVRTKDNNGTVIGDTVLISAEVVRNSIRSVVEKVYKKGMGGHDMPEWLVAFTEGANMIYDMTLGIMTVGAYPAVKYASSKALKIAGHSINGDTTCIKNEFSQEELARLLFDIETGITYGHTYQPTPNYVRLKNGKEFIPDGMFVHQNVANNINTVKYMTVEHHGTIYYIREKNPGEYWTYHPHAVKSELVEKRVFFDHVYEKIHFNSEIPENNGLNYKVIDGKKFITINGDNHEILWNWHKKHPEIIVNKKDGHSMTIPVYMEPLSKTWHLSIHNKQRSFSQEEMKIINEIKIDEEDFAYIPVINENNRIYGGGHIYIQKNFGDRSHKHLGHYIEMNGELVPVRKIVSDEEGFIYEIYDMSNPQMRGYTIQWEGDRWLFDKDTSVYVSEKLEKSITAKLFSEKKSAGLLSAPDSNGLRHAVNGDLYLKIKRKFINVEKIASEPGVIERYSIKNDNGVFLYIRLKEDGLFHLESLHERWEFMKRLILKGQEETQKLTFQSYHHDEKVEIFTTGSRRAETVIFPEDAFGSFESKLQKKLSYEQQIDELTDDQIDAILSWTYITRYSTGKDSSWPHGESPVGYSLNRLLRENKSFNNRQQFIYDNIISALSSNHYPTSEGVYFRMVDYMQGNQVSLLGMLDVGDILTNSKLFMSVSDNSLFINKYSYEMRRKNINQVKIVYRIDGASKAKPLFADPNSDIKYKEEYLYLPESYFKVTGISFSHMRNKPPTIGVSLEEVIKPDDIIAKDIFTGRKIE